MFHNYSILLVKIDRIWESNCFAFTFNPLSVINGCTVWEILTIKSSHLPN